MSLNVCWGCFKPNHVPPKIDSIASCHANNRDDHMILQYPSLRAVYGIYLLPWSVQYFRWVLLFVRHTDGFLIPVPPEAHYGRP